MFRRLPLRWCVPTLLAGIVVGLMLESAPWSRPVHAKPAERREPEPGDRGPALIEVSRQLARIAADVTPSVAHIESKFEHPTKGMVEETGSGVVVSSPKVPGYYV